MRKDERPGRRQKLSRLPKKTPRAGGKLLPALLCPSRLKNQHFYFFQFFMEGELSFGDGHRWPHVSAVPRERALYRFDLKNQHFYFFQFFMEGELSFGDGHRWPHVSAVPRERALKQLAAECPLKTVSSARFRETLPPKALFSLFFWSGRQQKRVDYAPDISDKLGV